MGYVRVVLAADDFEADVDVVAGGVGVGADFFVGLAGQGF
jgi:hypothetical protein